MAERNGNRFRRLRGCDGGRALAAAALLLAACAQPEPWAERASSDRGLPLPTTTFPSVPPPAAAERPLRAPPPVGVVTEIDGLRVLRLRGTPRELGYQHGFALAAGIKEGIEEFVLGYRCHGIRARYAQIIKRVETEIDFPASLLEELDGMLEGMQASGVDLLLPVVKRPLERIDLLVLNTLDHWGLFGCSGVTAWGDATADGEVLVARNFDFDVDQPDEAIARLNVVFAFEPAGGTPFLSLAFPGLIGVVTGLNAHGVGAFLHVGNGAFGGGEIGGTRPLMAIARAIVEQCDSATAAPRTREWLAQARIRNSFLLRVTTDGVAAPPTAIFEIDPLGVVEQPLPAAGAPAYLLTTNHFTTDKATFPAIPDSKIRWCALEEHVKETLATGDHRLDAAEAWRGLERIAQHVGNVTLHSLVWQPRSGTLLLSVSERIDGHVLAATKNRCCELHLAELLDAR